MAAIQLDSSTLETLTNSGTITGNRTSAIAFSNATLGNASPLAGTPVFHNTETGVIVGSMGTGSSHAVSFSSPLSNGNVINGDILNEGYLSGATTGLYLENSVVNGNIVNQGATSTITGTSTAGVQLHDSTLNGKIDNSGTITGGDPDTPLSGVHGLLITGASTLNGVTVTTGVQYLAISNSGTISALDGNAVYLAGYPVPGPASLTITGDIVNDTEGVLESAGRNHAALRAENAAINGSIVNRGNLWADGNTGTGISLDNVIMSGNVQNAGSIAGVNNGIQLDNAQITGGLRNESGAAITLAPLRDDDDPSTRRGSAILVNGGQVSGGILNAGTLDASSGRSGIELVNHAEVNGNVVNSGTIHASLGGVVVSDSTVNGLIDNQGTIQSQQSNNTQIFDIHGILITGTSTLNGITGADGNKLAIRNSGTITSDQGSVLMIAGSPDPSAPQPTSAGSMGPEMPPLTIHGNIVNEATGTLNGNEDAETVQAHTAFIAALGKTAGKDAAADKPTYVSLLGLAASQALADELRAQAHGALDASGLREGLQRALDVLPGQRGVFHRVELVHRKHQRMHAQQVHQQAVAAGLRQQGQAGVLPVELGGIDQHHGGVGAAGGRHHVAGVLLVAGRVANDELALFGGEVAVGHVDGDALFALGAEAVGQQGQVGFTLALHARQVVLQHGLAVYQEAANQCALAIVHAAAGDELEGGDMVIWGSNACWISAGSY